MLAIVYHPRPDQPGWRDDDTPAHRDAFAEEWRAAQRAPLIQRQPAERAPRPQ